MDFVPGPRGADRRPARGPALGLRDRVGALHRRPGRRPRGLRRLADVRARRGLERVLLGARRRRRQRAVRRARPSRPGEGLGRRARRRRRGDPRALLRAGARGHRAADVAIEVSTAGLRKPVGEIYPSAELLGMLVAEGKPVTLSSDAHEPRAPRLRLRPRAASSCAAAGVERICVWERPPAQRGAARMSAAAALRHRLRLAPVRRRRAAGAGRGRDPGRAGPRGPLRRRRGRARRHRRAARGRGGLGDIGEHFPDDDPRLRGRRLASSCCAEALEALGGPGWRVVNVDVTRARRAAPPGAVQARRWPSAWRARSGSTPAP